MLELQADAFILYLLPAPDYLDVVFGGESLWPSDPYEKTVAQTLVSDFGNQVSRHIESITSLKLHFFSSPFTMQFISNYYKYFWKTNDEKTDAAIKKVLQGMEQHINKIGGRFLMGERVGAADFLIWPWIERLEAFIETIGKLLLQKCAQCVCY